MTTKETNAARVLEELRAKWNEIEALRWSDDEDCITVELIQALQEFGRMVSK